MEATDKSGKVKFTFEMELNQPIMELIRQDIDMMMDLALKAPTFGERTWVKEGKVTEWA